MIEKKRKFFVPFGDIKQPKSDAVTPAAENNRAKKIGDRIAWKMVGETGEDIRSGVEYKGFRGGMSGFVVTIYHLTKTSKGEG